MELRRAFFLWPLVALCAASAGDGAWSIGDKERFLATAQITSFAAAPKGITKSQKITLSDGRRSHVAHLQQIDDHQDLFRGKDGSTERDFKDTWKCNVAAYRVAKMLHLTGMVPVTVERMVNGKPGSVTWWIEDIAMDELDRVQKGVQPPDMDAWNHQLAIVRVFDQLIYNMDRSRQNLLISNDWKVWMIDHTRSFRKLPTLRNERAINECPGWLLRDLQRLNERDLMREIGRYITQEEIEALLVRRDRIVQIVQTLPQNGMFMTSTRDRTQTTPKATRSTRTR